MANYVACFSDYHTAERVWDTLDASRKRPSATLQRDGRMAYRIGHNTYLIRQPYYGGVYVYLVRYHDTDVVAFWPDGRITLDSGGWHSKTTAERMTAFTPVAVSFRKAGAVVLDTRSGEVVTYPYADGVDVSRPATVRRQA